MQYGVTSCGVAPAGWSRSAPGVAAADDRGWAAWGWPSEIVGAGPEMATMRTRPRKNASIMSLGMVGKYWLRPFPVEPKLSS